MKSENKIDTYNARLKVATTAFSKGCLIFSPATKKYYTPREFLESNEIIEFQRVGMDIVPDVNLLYPKFIIEGKLKALQKAQNELDEVLSKVLNIFEFKPIPLKKTNV